MTQKLNRSPREILTPNGIQRTPVRLINGARNSFLTIIARMTVTVTVAAATAVRNRGSGFAVADEVILDEQGTQRSICTGKALRFASEMNAPSALFARRLDAYALANGTLPVGVYNIEEAARMTFAHPLAYNPLETAFVERNQNQALSFVVRANANPVAMLVTAGPATVTVTNIAFTVIQGYESPDERGIKAPLFVPTISEHTLQINGGNVAKKLFPIATTELIRIAILSQEVDGVEVGDIINAVALRGDYREIIGPAMKVGDVLLDSEFDFGGAVVSTNRSHMGWNFQRYGQMSEVLSPVQDVNLRWELDCQPSATAGQSQVRMTLFQLARDPKVSAPTIPFPI